MIKEKDTMENTELTIEDMELFRDILGGKEHNPTLIQETDTGYVILTKDNTPEQTDYQHKVYVNNLENPQTRQEMREGMQEDNIMTDDEIEEWLDLLEQ